MTTVAPAANLVSTQPASPHGLAGFLCEVTGSPVTFADCLACAKSAKNTGCPLTVPIVQAILAGIRPPDLANQLAAEHGAEIGFSVTELLHCPRRQLLEQDHTWYEKPEGLYRMTRGIAVHDYLSRGSGGLKECRLSWTFKFRGKIVTLTGMPDLVELRSEGLFVTDYKVTENPPRDKTTWTCSGCNTAVKKSGSKFLCPNCGEIARSAAYRTVETAQARSSHVMQINLYGLLIEKNLRQVVAVLGATGEPPVCGGEVLYLPPTLPMRCSVPYNRETTMAFLKESLKVLLSPDLPPVLAEEDEGKWECGFCPLAEVCAST
ncbi:MAG: hypothetical protein ABSA18_16065 [Dehalococcoidia bacterium]|jgi:predicted RNA-binding Zn-ribbon protein involved in translation (DUF1610 family)/CRISPR/Cas system-associated exonuclease Cas4 (RecB family)